MAVIKQQADIFECVGIDECFIDVSERAKGNFDFGKAIAHSLKEQILDCAKITCSIGIAPNKMLAKIASDYVKPDGLTIIRPEDVTQFISSLDLDKIPGIGPKTRDRLAKLGVRTSGELESFDFFRLTAEFGKKNATYIYNAARGVDNE